MRINLIRITFWYFIFLQLIGISDAYTQSTNLSTAEIRMVNGHPAWIMQGNIYEVNIRQYTREGTLKAFAETPGPPEGDGSTNSLVHALESD